MDELAIQQPELTGRDEELDKLKQGFDNAVEGNGSTYFVAGEAGIGKTRLVSELISYAGSKGSQIIRGWCLAESLEPLMPVKTGLREAGLAHLISGAPPPLVVSTYLMNVNGMLIAKAERGEMDLDSDIFAGMLQAVGNFVQDSLAMMTEEGKGGLNALGYQDYTILIQTKGNLSLATVIKGDKCEFLIEDMKALLEDAVDEFRDWKGDMSATKEIEPRMAWFVKSGKYDGKFLVDDPKIKQENLFDNILLGIQRASDEMPVLLFLDDLQWSDPTTMNLVHYLSRNTKDNKVLILGTYRPEDIIESDEGKPHQLETAMQAMSREGLFENIQLVRLDAGNTSKLVESILGENALEQSFFDKIFDDTEGSPFFILEVIKMLVEEGVIKPNENDQWHLVKGLEDLDIPTKIFDVVKKRLNRLMKEQREILDCASVIGEEFKSEIVGSVIGLNRIQLLKNLSEIEKTHQLIHYLEDKYRFDHAKVKEVLYNGIGKELRKEYHKIIGDTIAEFNKDNLEDVIPDLAYHYFEGGDARAGTYLLQAGEQAEEKYANEEAISLYEDALTTPIEEESRKDLYNKLGRLATFTGEYEKSIANYYSELELETDVKKKALLHSEIGKVFCLNSNYDAGMEEIQKGYQLIKEEETPETAMVLNNIGSVHEKKGEYKEAIEILKKSLEIAERYPGEKSLGTTHQYLAHNYMFIRDYEKAEEHAKVSIELLEARGDQLGLSSALNSLGALNIYKGENDTALAILKRSSAIAEKLGVAFKICTVNLNIGAVFMMMNDYENAEIYFKRSQELAKRIGDAERYAGAGVNLASMKFQNGEINEAIDHFKETIVIFKDLGHKRGTLEALVNIAKALDEKGKYDEAVDYLQEALELVKDMGDKANLIRIHRNLALTKIHMNELEPVPELIEKALDISKEIELQSEEGVSLKVLGIYYKSKNDWEQSLANFDKAKELLASTEDTLLAETFYECGMMFKAKGETDQAKVEIEAALKMFEEMDKKLWEEKCLKALGDL